MTARSSLRDRLRILTWTSFLLLASAVVGCKDSVDGGQAGAGAGAGAGATGQSGSGQADGGSGAGTGGLAGASGTSAGESGAAGTMPSSDGGDCSPSDTARVAPLAVPFDLVVVAGTSFRIEHARRGVGAELERLLLSLLVQDPGVRVVNIQHTDTTGAPTAVLTNERYRYLDVTMDADALDLAIDRFDEYVGHLRSDAMLQLLIIDDIDSTYQGGVDAEERARYFQADMELALTTWANGNGAEARALRVHAFASEGASGDTPCTIVEECCDAQHQTEIACLSHLPLPYSAAMPSDMTFYCMREGSLRATAKAAGPTYVELARRTRGSMGSVCSMDWATEVEALLERLRASAAHTCVYDMPAELGGDARDLALLDVARGGTTELLPRVSTAGDCGDAEGYVLANDGTQVELCPASCERIGGHPLDFFYGCGAL